ncbi:MAG TPA: universal stress protein [Kofleriaceae bacterium]
MANPRWIVVGTSFSERAQHALAYAIEVAARTGARIALVHAYEDSIDPPVDVAPGLRSRLEAAIERSGAARLGVHVEPVLRRGAPWDKLRNVATDLGADLLVIGASDRHDLAADALTTRAIASAARSVLVIAMHDPPCHDARPRP